MIDHATEQKARGDIVERVWYYDTEEAEPEEGWNWPAPTKVIESVVEGALRADVLARLAMPADSAVVVRTVERETEGGYSEWTVEFDYELEVWLDEGRQSQRVFSTEAYWSGSTLEKLLAWLAGGEV